MLPMTIDLPQLSQLDQCLSRRTFLNTATVASLTLALPRLSAAAVGRLDKPVQIGVIADLHHDVMHDGSERLGAFVKEMSASKPDAILQLGDFAYPRSENSDIINMFNQSSTRPLHVIGNHDTDAGFTKDNCIDTWGMPGRYYAQNIEGLQLLVLDGNDGGSPTHKGGYASYIGKEQVKWLKEQLEALDGPIIVVCHQPLAGAFAIDNADELQSVLGDAADKVILAINGHSHIDEVIRVKNVTYMHVNSASYQWVGGTYQHESYSKDVHKQHPWISHTCPYRDPLFATFTVEPENFTIRVEGIRSSWVGKSPAELGVDKDPGLTNGEEIAPRIRDREIMRVSK
jgi:Icc protein